MNILERLSFWIGSRSGSHPCPAAQDYALPLSEVLGHPDVQVPDACAQNPAKDAVTSHKGIAGELAMSWTCGKCE